MPPRPFMETALRESESQFIGIAKQQYDNLVKELE